MPKIIVITGPCGAGKTTIAKLVTSKLHIPHLQGDEVKEELFPGLIDISKHPHELSVVKTELLNRAKKLFHGGKSIVVDYMVIGEYIKEYKNEFGSDLILKVLLPPLEVIAHRDMHRDCWTAGKEHIEELYKEFRRDESTIGIENYIDNSSESAEQTADRLLLSLPMDTNS
jgi:adenylate kinase family enzyme